eukprot:TRINITY_DN53747_c1_g1_i1.p1 TRINITY_DN53747_c1_g1~~TRINITY_DN53747_c1_g1_i1.p1  ORF type:complete len:186 (-),score=20.54 TRINITY_DN53747_c1_g1_i1:91-648(-)
MATIIRNDYVNEFETREITKSGFSELTTIITPMIKLRSKMFKCLDTDAMTANYRKAGGTVNDRYKSRVVLNLYDDTFEEFQKGLEVLEKKVELSFLGEFLSRDKLVKSLTCRVPRRGLTVEDSEGIRKNLSLDEIRDHFDFDNNDYEVQFALMTKDILTYNEAKYLVFTVSSIKIHKITPVASIW